jgi:2'-5' RNA ligase
VRLFVSVDLPAEFAAAVAAVQEELRPADGLRFVDPERAHVTVKFLGEVSETEFETVDRAVARGVERSGVGPFSVTYGGLGVFPSMAYVSVVWLGVETGARELTRLHEAVETETTAVGVDPEDHDFTPHVTLARMDHAGGKEHVQEVVREQEPTVGTVNVEAVELTESKLGPDGPEYTTVRRYSL